MFCDEADIQVEGGRGGSGLASFRREQRVARGGPDGGDGGKGGDVIFQANPNLNTLSDFHTKKHHHAPDGGNGGRAKMHGANGEGLVLVVPIGTVIMDAETKEVIADIQFATDQVVIAKGGRGGFGNAHFASSVRQSPRFAEKGEPGQKHLLRLELKLVADVGIIGFPSVGKSTLISVISAARPKIAAYPFTTIIPNLGVVRGPGYEFVACDVPGLIEGASQGKGLGDQFLRHVERCRLLVHLLDATAENPLKQARALNKELALFSKELGKRPQLLALNKVDTLTPAATKKLLTKLEKSLKAKITPIAAVTRQGIDQLLKQLALFLQKHPRPTPPPAPDTNIRIIRPHATPDAKRFTVTKEGRGWRLSGERLEQIVVMTDFNNEEAMARVYDVLVKISALRKLKNLGAKSGDPIFIGEQKLAYHPED